MARNKEKGSEGCTVYIRYPQPTGDPEKDAEKKQKAFNNGLRKFKKMVQNEGIIQEYREREFYEKPTTRRRKEKAMARKRWLKRQRELENERWGNT